MKRKDTPRWVTENIPPELHESTLFKFRVVIGKITEEIDTLSDLDIDYDILEQHLETVPAQYMFWAAVYSELKANVAGLELKIRTRKSKISAHTIAEYHQNKVRLTDKQLAAIIDGDDELVKLEAKLVIAQKHAGKVYHMVEAIRIKSENCRSLAGFKRQDKEQSAHTT